MLYWHYALRASKKTPGKLVVKRLKGRKLQPGVDSTLPASSADALPPLEENPPQRGMPAVETNHGFTCKFNPCAAIGAACNHDLSPLARLPVLAATLREKLAPSAARASGTSNADLTDADREEFAAACSEMFASVIEHEYYCGAYASEEQPKSKALMKSMALSLQNVQDRIAAAKVAGTSFSNLETAGNILHNLVGAVNRCSHKGYPEIVSLLRNEPGFYCSHPFANLYMFNQQNDAERIVLVFLARAEGKPVPPAVQHAQHSRMLTRQKQLNDIDYKWRPALLEDVPWYFFAAMTEAVPSKTSALPWFSKCRSDSTWNTRPDCKVLHSIHFPHIPLVAGPGDAVPVAGPYYCGVRVGQVWCVPIILGRYPKTPSAESTVEDKGRFALFMLLLFKPWRDLKKDLFCCLPRDPERCEQNPWQLLYDLFQKWYAQQEEFDRTLRIQYAAQGSGNESTSLLMEDGNVSWRTPQYWAARSVPIMQTMHKSFSRPQDSTSASPTFFQFPEGVDDDMSITDESTSDDSDPEDGFCPPCDNDGDEAPVRRFTSVEGNPCGELPADHELLRQLLTCSAVLQKRGQEAIYCR